MKKRNGLMKLVKSKQKTCAIMTFILLLIATLTSMTILFNNTSVKAYPGQITAGNVSWYNWDSKGQTYGTDPVCRVNTSEYYLIAYSGTTDHGYVSTLRVWDSNGTIKNSVVSTWEFSSAAVTYYISVKHIPNTDKYVLAYEVGTASSLMTIKVWANNGTIKPSAIDTQALSSNGAEYSLINITQNVWVVAYQQTTTDDGFLETWWIDNTGIINNTQLDIQEFAPTQGTHPAICIVDADTIVISYVSGGSPNPLTMDTYNITSGGIITNTATNTWTYYAASVGYYCRINKIGSDKYCFVIENSGNDFMVNTTTITNTGIITKSWIDYLRVVDGTAITTFSTFFVDNPNTFGALGVMGLVCRGVGTGETDGYMYTWNISNDGSIGSSIASSYEFETDNIMSQTFPYVTWISNSWYLNIYCNNKGMAQTLSISTTGTPPAVPSACTLILNSDTFTHQGEVGTITYSNNSGSVNETAEFNFSYNGTQDFDYVRVNITDLAANFTSDKVAVQVSADNITWGSTWKTGSAGGWSYIFNSTTWIIGNGCYGSNPFPVASNTSIYIRTRVTIPAGIGAMTYTTTTCSWDAGYYS